MGYHTRLGVTSYMQPFYASCHVTFAIPPQGHAVMVIIAGVRTPCRSLLATRRLIASSVPARYRPWPRTIFMFLVVLMSGTCNPDRSLAVAMSASRNLLAGQRLPSILPREL